MNKDILSVVAAVLLLWTAVPGAAAGAPALDPQVGAVVQAYFEALQSGDTRALGALLGARERQGARQQLGDPGYGAFLAERYRDARLEILASASHGAVQTVDIAIWLSDAEAVRERLILRPTAAGGYLIVGRKPLSG